MSGCSEGHETARAAPYPTAALGMDPVGCLVVNRAHSTRIYRTFGPDADASDGDDEFSVLIAKVGDAIGKQQPAGAFALALPGLARPGLGGEHFASAHRTEIFEVLLGVQPAGRRGLALDAGRPFSGTKPLLTWPGTRAVRIELCHGRGERRWRDDAAWFGVLRLFRIVINRILIADGACEHQDM